MGFFFFLLLMSSIYYNQQPTSSSETNFKLFLRCPLSGKGGDATDAKRVTTLIPLALDLALSDVINTNLFKKMGRRNTNMTRSAPHFTPQLSLY
jgi:hypothetical protein